MIAAICDLPDRPAAVVRAAVPDMAPMADLQGIYGVVRLRVSLDATGAVREVVVAQSPSQVLIKASIRAARESTYLPARQRCKNVESTYEFRVLYDPNGPRASPPPAPSPTPSPTPAPVPDLSRPWRLVWEIDVGYGSVDLTLVSSGSFRRVDTTVPHRIECNGKAPTVTMQRVVAALRAAHPERWRGAYYPFRVDPPPTPTPNPAATPVPKVDVVALAPPAWSQSIVFDAAEGHLTLEATGVTYAARYQYGETERTHETRPAELQDLTGELYKAIDSCPTGR
jgi:TonB-like protein